MLFFGIFKRVSQNTLGKIPNLFMIAGLLVLTACNAGSLGEGLESSAKPSPSQTLNSPQPATENSLASPDPQTAQSQIPLAGDNQVASLPTGKSVTFLPVSNAPQVAVSNLAKSIRTASANNGLPVVASIADGAQYQVKGYFSALEDGSGTLLVYVWDVLDRNNKRVYRINGQEQTASKSSDPWGAISPDMLDKVANTTVTQLKSWLGNR